tara:strand:- start:234 stop:419 length:186 start_codon:yes stop_codon:yes gene_type:complete
MITRYQIVDPAGNVIEELNSQEEVNYYINTKRDTEPHFEFKVIPVEVSSVKPGFGRDPDLH